VVIDFVVEFTEIDHYLFFCTSLELLELLHLLEEEDTALFAGVELSEKL